MTHFSSASWSFLLGPLLDQVGGPLKMNQCQSYIAEDGYSHAHKYASWASSIQLSSNDPICPLFVCSFCERRESESEESTRRPRVLLPKSRDKRTSRRLCYSDHLPYKTNPRSTRCTHASVGAAHAARAVHQNRKKYQNVFQWERKTVFFFNWYEDTVEVMLCSAWYFCFFPWRNQFDNIFLISVR